MKRSFLNSLYLLILFLCIASVVCAQFVPAKTSSMKLVPDPKKIYEWSQAFSSSERLLVTVAVYDVNKFTTLIREKNNAGKIIAYRYASLPGSNGTGSIYHESGVPLKDFPQSFLSRLDAGYHINVPPSVADQIGNDFKGILNEIKDLLKGPQNEIDKLRSLIGKGSDPFGQMNIGEGSALPFGHQPKELHNGKMGPTPYEIVSGKGNNSFASEDQTVVYVDKNSERNVVETVTTHDDGTQTINAVVTRSDGTVDNVHTEVNSDHTGAVRVDNEIHTDGSTRTYERVYDHDNVTTVYDRSTGPGGRRGTPTEEGTHHFTSGEINNLFLNNLGWFAEEFCFRRKKEPADFLNPTRSPVADGAGGNVNVNHLGKKAVVNPNENKLKNINPNNGSDSAKKIQQTHVDPPNTRNRKGN